MGYIWNVMVSFGTDEFFPPDNDEEDESEEEEEDEDEIEVPVAIEQINAWLESDEVRKWGPLTELTADIGPVGMNATVYGGGFKNFEIESFIAQVMIADWNDPENVQIFLRSDEAQKWEVMEIVDGEDGDEG